MPSRRSSILWTACLAVTCGWSVVSGEGPDRSAKIAKAVLDASGVRGGLVVHLGCGRGQLTAALCTGDRYLVQGLDPDARQVTTARAHIRSLGRYGQVSVRQWDAPRLPYGDNMVNLVVMGKGCRVARDEVLRVLAPNGAAVTLDDRGQVVDSLRKPVPSEIGEWTHYLQDAGNNAVAQDSRIGPPHHLQWKSGPMWSRSHEFASSVQALVSAKGRLFGVLDEGIIGQPRGVPALWALVARDAFNGILLWRRPCDRIHPHALVAVGDRVYVTLENRGPLCILDAATGQTLRTCDETGRVSEIVFCENRLILSTQLAGSTEERGPHVVAVDPSSGRIVWKKRVERLGSNRLVAGSGRVCYATGPELVCLALDSGKELWRSDTEQPRRRFRSKGYAVLYEGVVFLTGGSTRAYSLETGKLLWTGPDGNPHARNPPGLFGINGLMWTAWGKVQPRSFLWQHDDEIRNGYDPLTGEIKKTVSARRLVTAGHHIRCYPPKATERYLLLNKRGVEFFDIEGKNHMRANWTRAACGFGMFPANGFLYTTPAQCFCYQGVLLTGLNALAAKREVPQREATAGERAPRLTRGPAYARAAAHQPAKPDPADWPTYRHDVFRSGCIDASLPVELDRVWTTSLCPPAFGHAKEEPAGDREGVLLLKSLDATIHGKGARKDDQAVVAWRGADTSITWKTRIEEAGKQPVWICQSNMGKGGSVFELAIGKQKLTGRIRHTDDWDDYIWVRVGEVDVPETGPCTVSLKPLKQVEGRLGNVAAVAIGATEPPPWPVRHPKLREHPRGGLTPPVAAEGKLFVAEPDAHHVHALDLKTGKRVWTFTADGRIDSPPTIHQGLCLFGGTDGHVYCLNADDGRLAWRFRAAPEERHICSMGRLESVWPAHGSVLVRDGKAYVTAGRSSYLDGGISVYALAPRTGEILHQTHLKSDEPDVSKYGGRPFDMEGAKSDLLVAGEQDIYLYQIRLAPDLTRKPMPRVTKLGDRLGEPHLMTNDGFLDTTWFNRTYWSYSERWPGYYFTYRAPKSGQILVFDETTTYALKVYTERYGHSPEFKPGTGYRLIADRNSTKPVLDVMDIGAEKGRGFSRTELPIWSKKVPIRAHGLLLARRHLYIVGPPDLAPNEGAYEAMIGKRGALFRVVSTTDGSTLAEFRMDEVPLFDALIAAGDRLYMSTMSGTVICLGAKT